MVMTPHNVMITIIKGFNTIFRIVYGIFKKSAF